MEDVAATTPRNAVAGIIREPRIRLCLDRWLVQLVATDRACVCRCGGHKLNERARSRMCLQMRGQTQSHNERGQLDNQPEELKIDGLPVQISHDQKVTAFLHCEPSNASVNGRSGP